MAEGLVAREDALATLGDLATRAAAGRGRLVVVSGEPGIGKSALVAELARTAESLGAAVVWGRAWELAEAPPYFPLRRCLASLEVPPEGDAFALWERVLPAFARKTDDSFVMWIVEDVHAADLGTLDLLTLLAQSLGSLRALVVVTARMQDARITERVSQRLTRMKRDGVEVALESLSPTAVGEIAERIAGRPLSGTAITELAALTGGNPLFVVECARAFKSAGAAPRAIPSLPHTVRQLVIERVAALPDDTRSVLDASAVLGREASAANVGRMLDKLPAQVIDAIAPALRTGIVTETRPGQYLFTHILVRDAIEDGIAPARRADLHGRAADALGSAGDRPEILVERARHALASMRADGDAIALSLRAAKLLEDQGAYDRAFAMHQRIEDARGPGAPDERLHLARIARLAGQHKESRRIGVEVLAWARSHGDATVLARAALALGEELNPGTVEGTLVSALEEARAALGAAPASTENTLLACTVLARLAAALQPASDPMVPVAMALDAIARVRALGDDRTIQRVLFLAGSALVDYAPIETRMAVNGELHERAVKAGDTTLAMWALTRLAFDWIEAGELERWEAAVDQILQLTDIRRRWRALLLGSMRAVARGDVRTSERMLVEVDHLGSISDDPALSLSRNAHVGQTARVLHRDDEIRAAIQSYELPMPNVPNYDLIGGVLRAELYARIEDRDAVVAELARLGDRTRMLEHEPFFIAYLAEAWAFVGDQEYLRRARRFFEHRVGDHVTIGHIPMSYDGPVTRVLGIIDSALGDHASAETLLRAAIADLTKHGYRPWIAQVHYELGHAMLRAGRTSDAGPAFARAAEIADEVGMPGLSKRARTLLTNAPPPAPPPSPASLVFAMTREGDVWRIDHAARTIRVKDTRGIQLLARLVDRPGEEVHVLALASDEGGASLHETDGGGDALDARARREYGERLADLESDIAEAEKNADRGQLEKLGREKTALESELTRAFGLGGRARASGSASERARVNVQRRLKDAIDRIGEHDADVGAFLKKAVRTGTYCRFLH